jgi:hypothetical protein
MGVGFVKSAILLINAQPGGLLLIVTMSLPADKPEPEAGALLSLSAICATSQ